MASQTDLYQSVTDRIVAALEAGTAPWVRPWKSDRSGAILTTENTENTEENQALTKLNISGNF